MGHFGIHRKMSGGIRMKARGSTVNLFMADQNPGNGELPLEIESHTGQNQFCPPFSFPWINEVPNGLIPVDINDGIPCLPKQSAAAKVGPPFICSQFYFVSLLLF